MTRVLFAFLFTVSLAIFGVYLNSVYDSMDKELRLVRSEIKDQKLINIYNYDKFIAAAKAYDRHSENLLFARFFPNIENENKTIRRKLLAYKNAAQKRLTELELHYLQLKDWNDLIEAKKPLPRKIGLTNKEVQDQFQAADRFRSRYRAHLKRLFDDLNALDMQIKAHPMVN